MVHFETDQNKWTRWAIGPDVVKEESDYLKGPTPWLHELWRNEAPKSDAVLFIYRIPPKGKGEPDKVYRFSTIRNEWILVKGFQV